MLTAPLEAYETRFTPLLQRSIERRSSHRSCEILRSVDADFVQVVVAKAPGLGLGQFITATNGNGLTNPSFGRVVQIPAVPETAFPVRLLKKSGIL